METSTNKKTLTFPLRLSLVLLIFGALFKIMHWPYAGVLMFTAGISIVLLYAVRFLNKRTKRSLDYVKLVMVLLWTTSYLCKVFHVFTHRYILDIGLAILFIYWFITENPNYLKNRKFSKKGLIKVIYQALKIISVLSLVFGVLFKIQHWPYGSILFVQGTLLLCLLLILDYFIRERA